MLTSWQEWFAKFGKEVFEIKHANTHHGFVGLISTEDLFQMFKARLEDDKKEQAAEMNKDILSIRNITVRRGVRELIADKLIEMGWKKETTHDDGDTP